MVFVATACRLPFLLASITCVDAKGNVRATASLRSLQHAGQTVCDNTLTTPASTDAAYRPPALSGGRKPQMKSLSSECNPTSRLCQVIRRLTSAVVPPPGPVTPDRSTTSVDSASFRMREDGGKDKDLLTGNDEVLGKA